MHGVDTAVDRLEVAVSPVRTGPSAPTPPFLVKVGIPALRVLAWIFTAILLAGVTRLLRKSV